MIQMFSDYEQPLLRDDSHLYHVTKIGRIARIMGTNPDKPFIGELSCSWSPYAPISVSGGVILLMSKEKVRGRAIPMSWSGHEHRAQEVSIMKPQNSEIVGFLLKKNYYSEEDVELLSTFNLPIYIRNEFEETDPTYQEDCLANHKEWGELWEADPDKKINAMFIFGRIYGDLKTRLERYKKFY